MAQNQVLPVYASNRRTNTQPASNRTVSRSASTKNAGTTTSNNSQPVRKRGWSKSAKGAVIGGVGGAVVGAIISKNKVKGAVIGGVVGAAGGYIIGRHQDKKDGRIR